MTAFCLTAWSWIKHRRVPAGATVNCMQGLERWEGDVSSMLEEWNVINNGQGFCCESSRWTRSSSNVSLPGIRGVKGQECPDTKQSNDCTCVFVSVMISWIGVFDTQISLSTLVQISRQIADFYFWFKLISRSRIEPEKKGSRLPFQETFLQMQLRGERGWVFPLFLTVCTWWFRFFVFISGKEAHQCFCMVLEMQDMMSYIRKY